HPGERRRYAALRAHARGPLGMTCREAIDVLDDYLESSLTPEVLEKIEAHLRACAPCRAYLATYERTAQLAAKVNRVEMPPEVKRLWRAWAARTRCGSSWVPAPASTSTSRSRPNASRRPGSR